MGLNISLASILLTNLGNNLSDYFLAIADLIVPYDSYGAIDPNNGEIKGSINVGFEPDGRPVSLGTVFTTYTITIETRLAKDTGYLALTSILDLHEFIYNYLYKELRATGIQTERGKLLVGLDIVRSQTMLKAAQDKFIVGQSLLTFEWKHNDGR